MQLISIPVMKEMIKHTGIGKRRALFFHGPSGVGKSEGVFQSCEENEGLMVDIRVSQYESIDFRGIPDIQAGTTVWNMPATMPFKGNPKFDNAHTDHDKPTYLFLDEVNQGDPSVMSVLYQLINDRRIGEHELMDNVVIICAGNRASDRGVVNKFPAPLNNRMTHAQLDVDINAWSNWAIKAGKNPVVIGFLKFRTEYLYNFESDNPQDVWASPRSWTFAEQDFSDTTLPQAVRQASIAGSVGDAPAVELQAFAEIMDSLVPIEEIIRNPTGVEVPTKLDMQWAMAVHVASHLDKETAEPLHKFLERMEPEMTVLAWTMAIQKDPDITDTNAFLFSYAPKYRGLFTT